MNVGQNLSDWAMFFPSNWVFLKNSENTIHQLSLVSMEGKRLGYSIP